jgi:hypothetical protein
MRDAALTQNDGMWLCFLFCGEDKPIYLPMQLLAKSLPFLNKTIRLVTYGLLSSVSKRKSSLYFFGFTSLKPGCILKGLGSLFAVHADVPNSRYCVPAEK